MLRDQEVSQVAVEASGVVPQRQASLGTLWDMARELTGCHLLLGITVSCALTVDQEMVGLAKGGLFSL